MSMHNLPRADIQESVAECGPHANEKKEEKQEKYIYILRKKNYIYGRELEMKKEGCPKSIEYTLLITREEKSTRGE